MTTAIRAACAAALILTFATAKLSAQTGRPADELRAALADLERWLGQGPNAQAWQRYLRLDELRAELASPTPPQPGVVREVLDRFESGVPGLEQPRFARVRQALTRWFLEISRPVRADLPEAARAAKDDFRPVSPDDVRAARVALELAMAGLERFLGTGANAEAWKRYLLWDQLQAELAAPAPDPQALDPVVERLNREYPGLDLVPFAAFREALQAYWSRLYVATEPEVQAEYAEQLERLAEALEQYRQEPTPVVAQQINDALQWLIKRGQAPHVVAAVLYYYREPNALAWASERLVAAGFERYVDQVAPVSETMLGTYITGTGRTSGQITARLVPRTDQALIEAIFNGTTLADTLGFSGSAQIQSRSRTDFQSRKGIYLDEGGFRTVPATAAARTATTPLGVSAGRGGLFAGMANQMAAQQVAQSRPTSEAITARRAEQRVAAQMNQQINEAVARLNRDYQQKFRHPLLSRGQFPPVLDFNTTNDYLYGVAVQARPWQVAAAAPPAPLEEVSDLGIRLHETAINNTATGWAGRSVTQEEFQQQLVELFGRLPEGMEPVEPGRSTWIITFAEERPLTVRLEDNRLFVTMRVEAVEGVATSRRPWVISAEYRLEPAGAGFRAVRVGEVRVEAPDPDERLSGGAIAERRNVQRQFEEELFEQEIVRDQGLELPEQWRRFGRLALVELRADEGWLTLGWKKP